MTTILAIDCATGPCSVAIWKSGKIAAYAENIKPASQSAILMPMVENALKTSGIGYRELTAIACTVGPGSFTGIRVGLAAARGIAFASGVKELGFTTLEAMAYAARAQEPRILPSSMPGKAKCIINCSMPRSGGRYRNRDSSTRWKRPWNWRKKERSSRAMAPIPSPSRVPMRWRNWPPPAPLPPNPFPLSTSACRMPSCRIPLCNRADFAMMARSMELPMRKIIPLCLLTLLLCGCYNAPPPPPLPQALEINFRRYQPIYLNVTSIEIVDEYKSPMRAPNVEHLMPYSPAEAMHIWTRDRLRSVGADKTMQVIVKDASVVAVDLPKPGGVEGAITISQDKRYDAKLSIEMRIYGGGAMSEANIDVTATRSVTIPENASVAKREAVFRKLTYDLMDMMNAELEKISSSVSPNTSAIRIVPRQ